MKHLYCSIFGHDFKVSKHVTYHVKEYKCKRCEMEVTNNGHGGFTKLTPKFREINSVLERIHKNRIHKKRIKSVERIIQKEHSSLEPLIEFDFPRV